MKTDDIQMSINDLERIVAENIKDYAGYSYASLDDIKTVLDYCKNLEKRLKNSIELPFSIGDTVYNTIGQRSDTGTKYVSRATITICNALYYKKLFDAGTLFLTREDAEKHLKSGNDVKTCTPLFEEHEPLIILCEKDSATYYD